MNRRGISLVELLVVLSGCTVVLSTSAVLLHRAMRSHLETRHFFDNERAAQRLSRQFRADVTQSGDAEIDVAQLDAGVVARFVLKDGAAVEYRHEENSGEIVRVQLANDGVARRETFRLGSRVRVAVERLDVPDRLVLEITAEAASAGSADAVTAAVVRGTASEMRLEATLGGGWPDAQSADAAAEEDEQ